MIISIVRMNRYVIKSLQIALATYSSGDMIISIVRMNRYVIKSLQIALATYSSDEIFWDNAAKTEKSLKSAPSMTL